MIILAIDTSGKSISVALSESGKIIDEVLEKTRLQHASRLLPAINGLLEKNNLTLRDIDLFATTTGPGSFTGIRIALSAIMGMAYGTGKKVYGTSSLTALAAGVFVPDTVIVPVLDARGGRVFSGIYLNGASLITETPREISDFLQLLSDKYSQKEKIIVVGDGSPLIKDFLALHKTDDVSVSSDLDFIFACPDKNKISAAEVAGLAYAAYEKGDKFLWPFELKATYGIESAAKRNLANKDEH